MIVAILEAPSQFSWSNSLFPVISIMEAFSSRRNLFEIEGVKSVFFGPDFITVTKVSNQCKQLPCSLIYGSSLWKVSGYNTNFVCLPQMDEDLEWTDIKRHALEAIANFFESGDPITTTTGAVYSESSGCLHCLHLNSICMHVWEAFVH